MCAMLDVFLILVALIVPILQCDALLSTPTTHLKETLTREFRHKPNSTRACPLMQDFDTTGL